ncbi:SMI1/KNR4 family protein [Aggregatibacter actinomycetemcomitans]|uniref:SMI1/KNR4 family protein n=1 Tax=Aggregatibacter actinomycetemcomitans TaxID=714 RepID=UPI00197C61A9|nr:SMI1/KNR4 family protein [Aggregatibacter actinomycetemcomitans]MBN6071294.1 SMI1/KNR4 family protein [Aggregatibacter actinomycetemcomitans]
MKKLIEKLKTTGALIRPVDESTIEQAERDLNIHFSDEYKDYLGSFGVISLESTEIYGLGVKPTSYLSLYKALPEMREENNFPVSAVPLADIGDGHIYLYDNASKEILVWASPNGGIVKKLTVNLEDFLISLLF